MIQNLSIDLIDQILEEVEDTETMHALAYCSRALRDRVQHRTFTKIRLCSERAVVDLIELIDENPSLSGYVKTLEVEVMQSYLLRTLHRFPNITSLTLRELDWATSAEDGKDLHGKTFPFLSKMSFDECAIEAGAFMRIVASFRTLRHLRLRSTVLQIGREDPTHDDGTLAFGIQLHTLELIFTSGFDDSGTMQRVSAVIRQLVAGTSNLHIELAHANYSSDETASVQTMIDRIGLTLVNFSISGFDTSHVNMSRLGNLRSITSMERWQQWRRPDRSISFVGMLNSIRSDELTHISWTIDDPPQGSLETVDWNRYAAVVRKAQSQARSPVKVVHRLSDRWGKIGWMREAIAKQGIEGVQVGSLWDDWE